MGHRVRIVLLASVLVMALIWECQNLFAHQISRRYFSPRLSYYYFWFLNTDIRHIGILLPVSVSVKKLVTDWSR